jgi:hypothetical protein
MQISSTSLHRPSPLSRLNSTAEPQLEATPQDSFTFSGSSKNSGAMVMLGFGVAVTGLIAGAQMDNPAVMMGSFMGGVALMVAANR